MRKLEMLVGLALALAMVMNCRRLVAATFTVTTTNESGPASLREAITGANAAQDADLIAFNIPGGGVRSISPINPLPEITQPLTIDGYTQPGASSNTLATGNNAVLRIELDGSRAGANSAGLAILGANCTVRGLIINRFSGDGLLICGTGASNNIVAGTFIGTDPSGTNFAGNLASGVHLDFGASHNRVGGSTPDARNRIAGNAGPGISVLDSGTLYNAILGNEIFANGSLGIDLDQDGVTTNDLADTVTGPNGLQNYPVLSSIQSGNGTVIRGSLTSAPSSTFRLEFFANAAPDPTGFGEGQSFLGATNVTTDGAGVARFTFTLVTNLPGGSFVTAAATDLDGNTSEFSSAAQMAVSQGEVSVRINGQLLSSNPVAVTNVALIELEPDFPSELIFYTLDGADPRFGIRYAGAIQATQTAFLRVVAFSLDGAQSAETNGLVINVARSPSLGAQPASQTVLAGSTAMFTVVAGGTPLLSYQWRFNNGDLAGATGAALELPNVQPAQDGNYTVVVSNAVGSVTSSVARLAVLLAPGIAVQPGGTTGALGTNVAFCVTASGSGPLRYQWRRNGVNIPQATNACHTIPSVALADGGAYSVVVANELGAATSDPALLLIDLELVAGADHFTNRVSLTGITQAVRGTNFGFTTDSGETSHAGKTPSRSAWYTWQAPTNGIARFRTVGSSFDTLLAVYLGSSLANLVEVASDEDGGGSLTSALQFNAAAGTNYAIVVDGFAGDEGNLLLSWEVEPTAQVLPTIVTTPASRTVGLNEPATFVVSASGNGLAYQWFFNGTGIPGATAASYTRSNVRPADVGYYNVRVSNNQARFVDSAAAVLEIGQEPNVQSRDKLEDLPQDLEGGGLRFAFQPASVATVAGTIAVFLGTRTNQILNNSSNSVTSAKETNHCQRITEATRWVALQPKANAILEVDTEGSEIPTVSALYTFGASAEDFFQVACAVDPPGEPRARMHFQVRSNKVYYLVADGYQGAKGRIHLNWALGRPPPANCAAPLHPVLELNQTLTLRALDACGSNGAPRAANFQWLRNGLPLVGQLNEALLVGPYQPEMAGLHGVIVDNFIGTVTNLVAILPTPLHISVTNPLFDATYLKVRGETGRAFVIQRSVDSTNWTDLIRDRISAGEFCFVDAEAWRYPGRVYRVLPGLFLLAELDRVNHQVLLKVTPDVPVRLERSSTFSNWQTIQILTNAMVETQVIVGSTNAAIPAHFFRLRPWP